MPHTPSCITTCCPMMVSVLQHMLDQLETVNALVLPLSEERLTTPWAPGEWTIKEVLAHIIDDERIIGYRALRFARNDQTLLPGFDQDLYTQYSGANARTLADILDELGHVRRATVAFFNSLEDEAFDRHRHDGRTPDQRARPCVSHRWPRCASHREYQAELWVGVGSRSTQPI